ncbi:hypothetical protein F2982_14295 [Rhizobium sp. BG4]|nr:hypothetical protein F2982_14295 [Rhizobium sp. BG4]
MVPARSAFRSDMMTAVPFDHNPACRIIAARLSSDIRQAFMISSE